MLNQSVVIAHLKTKSNLAWWIAVVPSSIVSRLQARVQQGYLNMIMRMRNLSLLDFGHQFLKPWWTSPANWWVVSPTEFVWNVILRPSETQAIPGPQELEIKLSDESISWLCSGIKEYSWWGDWRRSMGTNPWEHGELPEGFSWLWKVQLVLSYRSSTYGVDFDRN